MLVGLDCRAIGPGATGIGAFAKAALHSLAGSLPPGALAVVVRRGMVLTAKVPRPMPMIEDPGTDPLWYELELPAALEEHGVGLFFSPLFTCPVVHTARQVVTIHDVFPETHANLCTPEFARFWSHRVGPAMRAGCHAVTVSEWSKSQVVERLRIAPERVSVVRQPAGRSFRPVAPEEARPVLEKHGLVRQGYVLYVGAIDPRKNLERLVRAFARTGCGDLVLAVAGQPTVEGYDLRRFASEAGVEGKLRLLGHVADEDLPALYSGARCFAFPSLAEGFGRPVIEAMACGTPVVASGHTALPETCGGAALLPDAENEASIADALRAACSDDPVRERLIEAGMRRAAEFTPGRFATDLAEAFRAAEAGMAEGLWPCA